MSEPVVTNLAKFWNDEQGIGHVLFFPRTEFDDKDVEEYIQTAQKFTGGKPNLVLIDFSNLNLFSMGVFKRLTSPELTRLTIAAAIVVSSSAPYVAQGINFLLSLNKEPFPIKVVTNEKEGMDWLLTFKK